MANVDYNTLIQIQDKDGNTETHYPITKAENILGLSKNADAALKLLAANSYIIDDVTGETYKIGSSNGKFYYVKSDVNVKDLLETIVEAVNEVTN